MIIIVAGDSMKKRGFTLIELMIVISIVGVLSAIVVPKLGFAKREAKAEQLKANIVSIKNFLSEKRETLSSGGTIKTPDILSNQIKNSMINSFDGSRSIKNPYSGSEVIFLASAIGNTNPYSNIELSSNNISSSVIIFYVGGTTSNGGTTFTSSIALPITENTTSYFSKFSNASLRNHIGKVLVVVHYDGFVGFGVGENGEILNPFIIKFSNIKDYSLSTVKPSPTTNLEIISSEVTDYLFRRVKDDIIYVQNKNGNDEKNIMKYLYNYYPPSVEKNFANNFGPDNTDYVTSNGWKKVDTSKMFILFEQDQFFDINSKVNYKNSICIVPNVDGSPPGYIMYIIDGNGNISSKIFVY